jgi:uncharacterized phage protein gp47/JayE
VYTLAQLRTPQLAAAIAARLTAALAAPMPDGSLLPVAAWAPAALGGVELSVVEMVAGGLAAIVAPKLVQIVEGRFLDLAEGAWLTEYAWRRYRFKRGEATYTIQHVKLTSSVGGTFEVGDLWVAGPGDNRYVSIERVVLVADVPQNIRLQAEAPGSAYADVAGTVTKMVTAPAGLTAVNERASDFEDAQVSGASTGTVTAAFHSPLNPPSFLSVLIRIVTFGDLGSATFVCSVDGGATWSDPPSLVPLDSDLDTEDHLTIGPTWVLVGPGNPPLLRESAPSGEALARISFHPGTSPSFIQGTVFTLLKGNAIAQQGADEESDAALRERCRGRWASLSDVPTESLVRLWCRLASPEIARVSVDANPGLPGGIIVTIASGVGGASPAAQLAVRTYILARLRGYVGTPGPADPAVGGSAEESVIVNSAKLRSITPTGFVSVPRGLVTQVQQAADRLWLAYLASLDIGGLVREAELVQAIMDAGAIDAEPTLTGGSPNIQLDPGEVAVVAAGTSLTASLAWRPV